MVPSGRQYKANLPDGPAVIVPTSPEDLAASSKPYLVYGFDPTDAQIENRHAAIEFVQCNLRLLAGLYVVWRYADALGSRGFAESKSLFASETFTDVRHLIGEVTAKK